ncbi:MAG: hypothetical protein JF592_01435 [Microbacterium sp.]|uniref:Uncharacterized protein n=1 Tax=Microbacterium natoriense TaxID=284570 RepID=A0AAW8ESB3_9MICO|nr:MULTISPECIES: hypothetical protein [Microbacterium]MBW8761229.1 hypothetical protein [Microbacterium sp.]MDQ0646191.1 hypothetical protein [Microbacterium natoriense]
MIPPLEIAHAVFLARRGSSSAKTASTVTAAVSESPERSSSDRRMGEPDPGPDDGGR